MLAKLGGAERVAAMLRLVKLDTDCSGTINESEREQFEKLAGAFFDQIILNCQTYAVVGTLVLGITHLQTIGRPGLEP